MRTKGACPALLLAAVCLLSADPVSAQPAVGEITAVKNQVRVTHAGQDRIAPVKLGDSILFMDTYETAAEARAKLLFEDDSLLTLGEKTRLQIAENVYNPAENRRSAALNVLSGRLRVLVGKFFSGAGSKFEIHTPTAVAAARGTYYLVWLFEEDGKPVTGIVTLEGSVEASNIDAKIPGSARLGPKQYTLIGRSKPPTAAAAIDPALLAELLSSTEAADERKEGVLFESQQPEPGLIPDKDTLPFAARTSPSLPDEPGVPSIPPILQQPLTTTPVNVEIRFP